MFELLKIPPFQNKNRPDRDWVGFAIGSSVTSSTWMKRPYEVTGSLPPSPRGAQDVLERFREGVEDFHPFTCIACAYNLSQKKTI